MRKSFLRASAGLQALALLGAGTAASFMVPSVASAQDYTSGSVTGRVTDNTGRPVSGATIALRSAAVGQTRTLTSGANGQFSATGLAPGDYEVSASANGFAPFSGTINVAPARANEIEVNLVAATASREIIVTGSRIRQVQSQGATGLAVDVPAITANVAVPRDITGVALLAPTTARGATGFTSTSGESVPTIGGGSVAENAYYINGLNITNPDTYIGSARVPFDFFKSVDVQTGGYPAEFGRATGGVVNSTTKSGTNNPFAAVHVNWQPRVLQSRRPNIGNPANPTDLGVFSTTDRKEVTLEAGGAAVPDHVFLYGLIQGRRDTYTSASASGKVYHKQTDNDPFWGAKADIYINPTQHAEFTIFDTRAVINDNTYAFTANAAKDNGTIGASKGVRKIAQGGLNWVGRYTGDVTDFLTLSAAYGVSKDRNDSLPPNLDAYYIVDQRQATTGNVATVVSLGQPFISRGVLETKRRFYRGDADLRVNLAGQHHFRFGFDNEDLSETKTTRINGTYPISYTYNDTGILMTYEVLGGHISATDTAFYAQDTWNTPLAGLTLNLGIRDDIFKQYNLSGEQYANLKNNWGPRLAFNYSPPSLEKWKFFGSFGRYFIPPAMNLGFRGRDLYFQEYFDYPTAGDPTSLTIDPSTGLPTGPIGAPLTNQAGNGFGTFCPTVDLSGAPGAPVVGGGQTCAVFGAGVQDPALAKFARDAKATSEDEFILGLRYRANRLLSFGLQGTYRRLNRLSEDSDFSPYYISHWCGSAYTVDPVTGAVSGAVDNTECGFYLANSAYHIWDVGQSSVEVNDFYQATLGKALPITLTGLNFPKAKRTYSAIVLDFSRADDGKWLAAGSVTWSQLKGNTEGSVRSDVGNGVQTDTGATIDFDYAGLADNSYGYLANDHRWVIKAFGAYHFNRYLTLGANVLVQSPGELSCLGIHPTDPYAAGYGPYSFFCGTGLTTDANGTAYYPSNVASPRGTYAKTDWLKQLDLSARVNIPLGRTEARKLVFRADVFNVFNSQAVIQRNPVSESAPHSAALGGGYTKSTLFMLPNAYQTPRYVRLGLDILWGGEPAPPPPVVEAPPPPPPPPPPPATQTCPDGSVILATATCPAPPPPPPPPPPAPERGF
jgi:hypothetical protein